MQVGERPCRPRRGRRRLLLGVAGLLLAVAGTGCGGAPPGRDDVALPPAPGQATSATTRPDLSDADLWLSFEDDTVSYDGATAYPDALGGPFDGRVVTANAGRVEHSTGADGSATSLAFPVRCRASSGCPRAMVEVLPDAALDPREDDFEYGASVWLARDQTTTGSNIVQKGRFGTVGGQWKLQVDTATGEPSCVVRSGAVVLVVRSRVSVADAAWHRVVCRRGVDGISISVDGTSDRTAGRTGSVSNPWPVRIGSPGVGDLDDQFHGRVDDVFLRIDRRS